MKNLHILQQESIDEGRLQVRVRQKNMGTPVADARVSVSYSKRTGLNSISSSFPETS